MLIEQALATVERRLRYQSAFGVAGVAFVSAVTVSIAVLIGVKLLPIWDPGVLPLLIAPFVVGVLAFLVAWFARKPTRFTVAVALDRGLGLRERVSTATYLGADASDPGGSDEVRDLVQEQASLRLREVTSGDLRAALKSPRRLGPLVSAGALAATALLAPLLPNLAYGEETKKVNLVEEQRDRQRVREAARKMEKRAKEIERAAELRQLELARKAARKLQIEARKMSMQPPAKKEALSKLGKLSDEINRSLKDLFSPRDDASPLNLGESDLGELSDLARELDQLDPDGLSMDLEEFKKSLDLELEASKLEGRAPRMDQETLRDLMDRFRDLEEGMQQLQDFLRERNEEEYANLSQEQLELLRRIQEQLGAMQSYCKSCQGSGQPMSAAELEELLKRLESLSEEQLQKLLKAVREADSLEALSQVAGMCRSEMSGAFNGMGEGQLQAMLQRLKSMQSGGSMGSNPGRASGGQAPRGPDDGRGEEPERVRGRLDPTGKLGQRVPFKGVPNPKDAKLEFDEAVGQAAAEAEESLGRDLLPPDARPYVRRYFEALQQESDKK